MAKHGSDPAIPGADRAREYVPVLITGESMRGGVGGGERDSFTDLASTIGKALAVVGPAFGVSFWDESGD